MRILLLLLLLRLLLPLLLLLLLLLLLSTKKASFSILESLSSERDTQPRQRPISSVLIRQQMPQKSNQHAISMIAITHESASAGHGELLLQGCRCEEREYFEIS